MAAQYLFRSVPDLAATGRTLEGLAIPWDRPTRVRDLIGPAYYEAFAPEAADVSIRNHASFPLFIRHEHNTDPIGVVTFQRSSEGLVFVAPVSKTQRGDEYLELVRDGAMNSTSIGFKPIRATKMRATVGEVTRRTEVALREMSLAASGFGQYDDARVLAVRDEQDGTPLLDAARRKLALLTLS